MANNSFKVKNSLVLTPVDLSTLVSPQAGDLACDINDNNKIKRYDAGALDWIEIGSGVGGGGLDVFHTNSFDDLVDTSSFSKGRNATFLGGGAFQGTLSLDEVSPITGTKSLEYLQAAGSLNDYFASEPIDLDFKQKDNTSGMTFYFDYDGNDNDGRFVVYDVTNSREIASEVSFVKKTSKATRYSLSFYVPASCFQIQWGYQVVVANNGAKLVIDDVEMSTNPFVSTSLFAQDSMVKLSGGNGYGSTATLTRRFLTVDKSEGLAINYVDSSVLGGQFIAKEGGVYHISYSEVSTASAISTQVSIQVNGIVVARGGDRVDSPSTSNRIAGASWSGVLSIGDIVTAAVGVAANNNGNSVLFTISKIGKNSEHILTPSDTFSTDTAPLTYANAATYTLSTLANAPIGTYITFTYASSTNTRTQTTGTNRPTQTDADMNQNGIRIFTRAYSAASTAAEPAAIAIQIGKGLKGTSLNLYKNVGKDIAGVIDKVAGRNSQFERGLTFKEYSESTGVLIVDAGLNYETGTTSNLLSFIDATTQTSGYLTINASRSLPLLAVPVPLTAYLKDVKPSGTAGGTFTSGAWRTRTLNTVEGDGSIVSLSGNQFTLGPGKYEIEASAPAYAVNSHKIKLRNITDSLDAIVGGVSRSRDTEQTQTASTLKGKVSVSSTNTYEIQHYAETTSTTLGFGVQAAALPAVNVFTQVMIKKVG
jgi:hypothetical protein